MDQNPVPPLDGRARLRADLIAGLVVFLVALPLCLGVALASGASPFSGVLAGIVGGLIVGALSGSHTSVAGPAAGLTAVVAAEIAALGSFDTFLTAVLLAGVLQIGMGWIKAGGLSAYIPTSVIKGLLAAIGVILILKQVPHLLGHDKDPEGEMAFQQPDHENTFSELGEIFGDMHAGAALIGFIGIGILLVWDRVKALKYSVVPGPLVVVIVGASMSVLFRELGLTWRISESHLVQVPVSESLLGVTDFLLFPNFKALWTTPQVYMAAITIALLASLETLLNLEAVDKLDQQRRTSPPNRELFAQGAGNIVCGLIGGIPVTSVIVRSSVNINSGGQTKLATIVHGSLLLLCVMFLPTYLNAIPLSCLAAILIMTGIKLASPRLFIDMARSGWNQFAPFLITLLAIVFTDLLIGVLIGLGVSILFILYSNMERPVRRIVEKHVGGEVLRIELANQVSFLNRASIDRTLNDVPHGGKVLLDARSTTYIDPDVLAMIREFKDRIAPARDIQVSLLGFRDKYQMQDEIQYVDYSNRDVQSQMTPAKVLDILKDGNERFRTGRQLTRDYTRQVNATAEGQFPLAVVLSCIDSRTPAELIFDLGLGDIFSVRIAGNISSERILGSIEYGCAVAGAKLIVVLGHTRCGAVSSAVDLAAHQQTAVDQTGCGFIDYVTDDIRSAIDSERLRAYKSMEPQAKIAFANSVARENVARTMDAILERSEALQRLIASGKLDLIGGMYDVGTGEIEFLPRRESVTT